MKRILRRIVPAFAVLIGIACLLPYLIYKGVYYYELRFLPEMHTPVSEHTLPEAVLNLAWHYFSGTGPRKMTAIRFDQWIRIMRSTELPVVSPASWTTASAAADILIQQNPHPVKMRNLHWHAYNAATTIWVSHHWTIDEALATILVSSYYGHDSWGIHEAAMTYFQKSLQHCSVQEVAVLLAPLQIPGLYDPWCHPERALERANILLSSVPFPRLPYLPESLVVPPPNTCRASRRKNG